MMLGAVLAGGQSTRFGSDKAEARIAGQSLLEHAVAELSAWCDQVVVAGRARAPVPVVPDWPAPAMGPLGGLAGALRLAAAQGYASVLTCGVDSPGLPAHLPQLLGPAPACLAAQPIVGHWPVTAAGALEAFLQAQPPHGVYRFARLIEARLVEVAQPPANLNTPEDLAAFRRQP